MRKNKGFTLAELLISSSIFLVVITTIYSAFQTGIFGYRNIEDRLALYQSGRFILERINLDLRNAFAYSREESRFFGSPTEITFLSLVSTYAQQSLHKEYALVSYRWRSPLLMRLCRRNKQSLNEKSVVEGEEMAEGLEELRFEYGYIDPTDKTLKFKDSWAGVSDSAEERKAFPAAVRVRLVLKNKSTQDFQRTIYLAQAWHE